VNGQCPIAALLLRNGADPTLQNKVPSLALSSCHLPQDGITPLTLAKRCQNSHCETFIRGYMVRPPFPPLLLTLPPQHYHERRKLWLSFYFQIREETLPSSPALAAVLDSSDLGRYLTELL
jgi:hypothetical protein